MAANCQYVLGRMLIMIYVYGVLRLSLQGFSAVVYSDADKEARTVINYDCRVMRYGFGIQPGRQLLYLENGLYILLYLIFHFSCNTPVSVRRL